VHFSTVNIREYDRIVGDHPDVSVGPPLSISWEYIEREPMDLDDYECSHTTKGNYNLYISSMDRKNMLQNVFQVPPDEIRKAEKKVKLVKAQRTNTAQQGKAGETIEAILQSAKRKLKRIFSSDELEYAGSQTFTRLSYP
jgi:hypothetical protein